MRENDIASAPFDFAQDDIVREDDSVCGVMLSEVEAFPIANIRNEFKTLSKKLFKFLCEKMI